MAFPSPRRPRHGRADLFVLVVVLAAAASLTQLPDRASLTVTRYLRGTVLAPFLAVHAEFEERSRLADRVARLRAERDSLARELARRRAESREIRELRELLEMRRRQGDRFLPVELKAPASRTGSRLTFWLEVGERQGIASPTGVLAPDGLLGVIRSADARASRGEFWTHPDFRVSVRTEDGTASGIVRPSREADQPVMVLEGAPYQTEIPEGTVLFTSGLGGVYPPGLPVGRVREVLSVESGWKRNYRVDPAVRPAEAGMGLVWLGGTESP